MFGAIAAAVAPTIVGRVLGGGKPKTQKTVTENDINYAKMARKARAAGFNPLTALRNGGSAMGTTTSTTTAPQLSSGEFVADAMQAGFGAFNQAKEVQRDNELRELEKQALQEEIKIMRREANTSVYNRDFGYSIPKVVQAAPASGGTHIPRQSPLINSGPERNVPLHQQPATVLRDDGLTGSNPEAPRELDADFFQWTVDGTLDDNFGELLKRNNIPLHNIEPNKVQEWVGDTMERYTGARTIPEYFRKRREANPPKRDDWSPRRW